MTLRPDFATRYGPWALVTGAAQGIGAAYTERLAGLGLSVVLLDVEEELLDRQAARVRSLSPGVEVRTLLTDLSDAPALQAAVEGLDDLEVGLLVANAGIGAVGRWLEVPLETKLRQVAVNCASVVVLADRLTPKMVERRRGGVIVMSSGSAQAGSSFIVTYAATKAFDRVFAEGLWSELGPYGVDVTTVMPGAVDTPGFRDTVPAGHEPTRMMQPVDPFTIVDAALAGLGTSVNVTPGPWLAGLLAPLMGLVPRQALLRLGDKAVRQMYDR
ncbi:MAG: Short-chain dehydrogenase [Frankiales bacterium]|nr:Short-chain dehydrogenase [Frankiales bacterium]